MNLSSEYERATENRCKRYVYTYGQRFCRFILHNFFFSRLVYSQYERVQRIRNVAWYDVCSLWNMILSLKWIVCYILISIQNGIYMYIACWGSVLVMCNLIDKRRRIHLIISAGTPLASIQSHYERFPSVCLYMYCHNKAIERTESTHQGTYTMTRDCTITRKICKESHLWN